MNCSTMGLSLTARFALLSVYRLARCNSAAIFWIPSQRLRQMRLQICDGRPTISAAGHGWSSLGGNMNTAGRTTIVLLMACAVAAALRLGAWLPNVTAVGALALYAGSRVRPWFAWIPALAVMAATDLILERWYGYPPFNRVVYSCFLIDAALGMFLLPRITPLRVGIGAFVSALQFFLITNFYVWLRAADSAPLDYPKTVSGLMTCYAMALPFFGYTLLGNLVFGGAFFAADAALSRATVPAIERGEAR
jgi:hypothetical protein